VSSFTDLPDFDFIYMVNLTATGLNKKSHG